MTVEGARIALAKHAIHEKEVKLILGSFYFLAVSFCMIT